SHLSSRRYQEALQLDCEPHLFPLTHPPLLQPDTSPAPDSSHLSAADNAFPHTPAPFRQSLERPHSPTSRIRNQARALSRVARQLPSQVSTDATARSTVARVGPGR